MGESRTERRRSFRLAIDGQALLWRGGIFAGRFAVRDISMGGLRISGAAGCDPGSQLGVTLHLADMGDMALQAQLVYCDAERSESSLCFVNQQPQAEDRIQDLIVGRLESQCGPAGRVLLLHPRPEQAVPVMRVIEDAGQRLCVASTPVDAIWSLDDEVDRCHTVVMTSSVDNGGSDRLVSFLAHRYPGVRRIVLMDAQTTEGSSEIRHADHVLPHPWDLSRLASVVPRRTYKARSA